MRKIILTLIMVALTSSLVAQNKGLSEISLSYFGYNIAYPGVKIGVDIELKNWDKLKLKKKGEVVKHKKLIINPQIGFYNHKNNHTGVLLNTEFGIETSKTGRFYNAHSLGLGYITHLLAGSTYTLNNENKLHQKKNDKIGYIMTSYNYELGQHINNKFTWFCKVSLASKMFYNLGMSFNTFQEIGIKYRFK